MFKVPVSNGEMRFPNFPILLSGSSSGEVFWGKGIEDQIPLMRKLHVCETCVGICLSAFCAQCSEKFGGGFQITQPQCLPSRVEAMKSRLSIRDFANAMFSGLIYLKRITGDDTLALGALLCTCNLVFYCFEYAAIVFGIFDIRVNSLKH